MIKTCDSIAVIIGKKVVSVLYSIHSNLIVAEAKHYFSKNISLSFNKA